RTEAIARKRPPGGRFGDVLETGARLRARWTSRAPLLARQGSDEFRPLAASPDPSRQPTLARDAARSGARSHVAEKSQTTSPSPSTSPISRRWRAEPVGWRVRSLREKTTRATIAPRARSSVRLVDSSRSVERDGPSRSAFVKIGRGLVPLDN